MSAPDSTFSTPAPRTAVIYCRVSTVRQADEELPIQSQRQRCEDKACALGATVLRVYADEGLSGQSDSRPAFQRAILYCETHAPSYFVTWSTSRFARNRLDAQLYKRRLSRAGVTLVYAGMEIDRDSEGGWLTEGIMELFDEYASKQVAADTRRSMIRAAQQGYRCGGIPPFGYVTIPAPDDPKRRRLAVNPDEASIAQRLFDLRAQGIGARQIAMTLNGEGCLNRAHRWNKTSVLALLRNQALLGNIVFGRVVNSGGERYRAKPDDWIVIPAHPSIIDRAVWDLVQRMLDHDAANTQPDGTRGSPHSTYLFTGMLRCGRCGSSLQIETAKGRHRRYAYYNCRTAQRRGDCVTRRLPARDLDAWLFEAICVDVLTPENLRGVVDELRGLAGRWQQDREDRRRALEQQRAAIARRNGRLYEVLEEMGRDTPNLADLAVRLRENNVALKALESQIEQLAAEDPPRCDFHESDLDRLAECLVRLLRQEYNIPRTRTLFSDFVEKIRIESTRVTIEYNPCRLIRAIPSPVPSKRDWLPDAPFLGTRVVVRDLPERWAA